MHNHSGGFRGHGGNFHGHSGGFSPGHSCNGGPYNGLATAALIGGGLGLMAASQPRSYNHYSYGPGYSRPYYSNQYRFYLAIIDIAIIAAIAGCLIALSMPIGAEIFLALVIVALVVCLPAICREPGPCDVVDPTTDCYI
jgi:hypothetical protein